MTVYLPFKNFKRRPIVKKLGNEIIAPGKIPKAGPSGREVYGVGLQPLDF